MLWAASIAVLYVSLMWLGLNHLIKTSINVLLFDILQCSFKFAGVLLFNGQNTKKITKRVWKLEMLNCFKLLPICWRHDLGADDRHI